MPSSTDIFFSIKKKKKKKGFCFSPPFLSCWLTLQLFGGRLRKSLFIKGELQLWILNATKALLANKNRIGKSSLLQFPVTTLLQRSFILSLCGYDLCSSNPTKCWNQYCSTCKCLGKLTISSRSQSLKGNIYPWISLPHLKGRYLLRPLPPLVHLLPHTHLSDYLTCREMPKPVLQVHAILVTAFIACKSNYF